MKNYRKCPNHCSPIQFPQNQPPILLVVVDTEEEFDWSRFDRSATSVQAIRHIDRVQKIFDAYNLTPTYVVDYPVASQPDSFLPLKEIQDSGRALIGAHVHPWVNPPHEEEVCTFNSYPGNLPGNLEAAKLRVLTEEIEQNFGIRPSIYKAGRYGVGPNTASILEEKGYEVDLSVCPPVDYRDDGGPDFSSYPPEPYWFGQNRYLLEIPISGAFIGFLKPVSLKVYRFVTQSLLAPFHIPGILVRLGALDRLRLSPEGFTSREHIKLTQGLLRAGVRTFTWSFHSPSVVPGCIPYVQSQSNLDRFLDSFQKYFDYFFGELGGITMTPLELKQYLEEMNL